MTSRSRLGKGLGALFPDLPGVQQKNAPLSHEGKHGKGSDSTSHQQRTGSAPSDVTAEGSVTAKPDPSANVSRETLQHPNTRVHEGDVHATDEWLKRHPSDWFFTSTANQESHSEDSSAERFGSLSDKSSAPLAGNNEQSKLKPVQGGYLAEIRLDDIVPKPSQPRTIFDETEMAELAKSITEVGILQPIVVRPRDVSATDSHNSDHSDLRQFPPNADAKISTARDQEVTPSASRPAHYEIIMGERRWRAAGIAHLSAIPAIVKTTADDQMLRNALLENLHRVALNPLEEAAAYQQMLDEFGLTQAQLSKSIAKSRPQIANTLRLLQLPPTIQHQVASGVLSAGHARALLGLSSEQAIEKLAKRIVAEGLSVRATEEIVALQSSSPNASMMGRRGKRGSASAWSGSEVQRNLEDRFDTKVNIKGSQRRGRIEIVFASQEDMKRVSR